MIKVETKSFIPIYEQIKKEIKNRISQGIFKANEPLPSMRELATQLLINPNTVARAYRELEQEGFIYTRKGKGCYVSDNSSSLVKDDNLNLLTQLIDKTIEEAKKLNINPEEIKRLFEKRLEQAWGSEEERGKE
jgi:GntR family transcriptional regulator